MKPQIALITVFVVLFSIFAISHRPVQAADLSAGYTDKAVPHSEIGIPTTQVDPPVTDEGLPWGVKMVLAYIGLSAGSILLNYLWIQSSKPKLNRTR